MKKNENRKTIKKSNLIALIAVFLLIVTNPLVAVHIETGIQWVFLQIIDNSGYVGFACLGYLVGLHAYREYIKGRVKIPKTAKKSGLKYES